jgi:hypothetical protein
LADEPVHVDADLHDIPKKQIRGLPEFLIRLAPRIRAIIGAQSATSLVEAKDAVAHFLQAMEAVAARTYPNWSAILNARLSDCTLSFEDQRALIDRHPIDDYYLAGIVALEAARMRHSYTPAEADEILGEIGEQVDGVAGRMDRVVSDLVFDILGQIELGSGVDRMKMPHDKVVKAILQHMGFKKNDFTRELLFDVGFRHSLGEPLALHVPQWWKAFREQFIIHWPEPEPEPGPETTAEDVPPAPTKKPEPKRRWRKRKASSLMDA